ncbi:polysaccharide deacetylase [Sinorhizobium sp. BG8]|uniref:polysaccharide deacetylase family protein n=1 Tax=Sinorhizobium sp. BG8 TaxID=2613773 RepID=UPI00193E1551|nr:polysaccharide deacetylase [Sinorhizobium sp. BG8]QRM57678.1 polysaccharide deacetylase [Sinorhizobium sp. BG8]
MTKPKNVQVALTFDYDAMSVWIGGLGPNSPCAMSRGEFGPQGVRRILALLKEHEIRATFFVPGHTALAFPKTVEDIAAAGHEIGHHGWVHENPAALTADQERHVLEKGFEALEKVVGIRPRGYRSPGWENSVNTIPLLVEYGFNYESSLMGSEYSPYWCRIGDEWSPTEPWKWGKPVDLVELPVSWMLDDFLYFEYVPLPNGYLPGGHSPRAVLQTWIDEFDYLYEKVGEGIFIPTMHPQVTGRGARMFMLEGLIRHIAGKPGVTFTTCNDYVDQWRIGKTPSLPVDAAPAE